MDTIDCYCSNRHIPFKIKATLEQNSNALKIANENRLADINHALDQQKENTLIEYMNFLTSKKNFLRFADNIMT
jgi:hypothetical protein